jgi:pimeloyl-ACP methyl ester carboxylesterase
VAERPGRQADTVEAAKVSFAATDSGCEGDPMSGPDAERLHTIAANGLKLAYRVAGDSAAPPMVLLHALGMGSDDWRAVMPRLAETHHVFALDMRGHGASDHPGQYSFELMCRDVISFLDAVAIERCVLIGHSMGGSVAVLVAETIPDRITRLVLEDTPPPKPGFPRRPHPTPPDRPLPFDFAVVNAIIDQLNDPDPAWWDRAPTIDIPTLVIAGGPESTVPQDVLRDLVDRMPAATMITISAGHFVHAARPEEFLSAVSDFLTAQRS